MDSVAPKLRHATVSDLPSVNAVVERAVMTWDLPDRVKRLSLPSYRYSAHDLDHLEMVVAEGQNGRITGVAAWEPAEAADTPPGHSALLLHGVYVEPALHGGGIGHGLIEAAQRAARVRGLDGTLVKAQRGAEGFFMKQGFGRIPVEDAQRDYPNRLWRPVDRSPA